MDGILRSALSIHDAAAHMGDHYSVLAMQPQTTKIGALPPFRDGMKRATDRISPESGPIFGGEWFFIGLQWT